MFGRFKNKKPKQKPEPQVEHPDQVVKALEALFASKFIDKKTLYLHNFLRGVVVGAGSVLGATVVIAALLWVLSLFDTIPLIGPLLDATRDTIQSHDK